MEPTLVNLGELATVLGISQVTIRKWVDTQPDFPVHARGDHGRAYAFDARAVKAWLDAHREQRDAAHDARRAEIAQLQLELTGGAVTDGAVALTAKERREALEVAIAEAKWQETLGSLVRASDVRDVAEQAFAELRAELMRLPDAVGRLVDLDREQRARIDDAVRAALAAAANRIGRLTEPLELTHAA